MSCLQVRYCAVLTFILGSFVLLQAQPQQSANSTPAANGRGSQANAQSPVSVTEPFSVVPSQGTWTNQSGIPTVHGYALPFGFSDLFGYGYDHFLPSFPWKGLGGIIIEVGGDILDARSAGCEGPGEPGSCLTVVSPDGHVLYPGDVGAGAYCFGCPPYQEPGSGPILLNVPTRSDSTGSVDSATPNSSNGIVIDNQLVSDSSAPATNSITIETQSIANPSNDGIEAEAPVTPISIESSLLPDSPSVPTGHSAKSGGAHIDWAGVISDSLQILDAGVRAYDALHTPAISIPPSPARATAPPSTNTLNRANTAPPQKTSHNTSPHLGTPGRGTPHPTPTPVPVNTPPSQNCSGGICCAPPSVPNPAAVACLNSPTPGCDHPNGPGSWLQFCISR